MTVPRVLPALPVLFAVAFGLLSPAAATPPVPIRALERFERAVGGALAQAAVLREKAAAEGVDSAIAPLALTDLATDSPAVALALLRRSCARLGVRLAQLRAAPEGARDPRVDAVLHYMERQLAAVREDIERLATEADPERRRTLALRIEEGLGELDGASAALWTFDR